MISPSADEEPAGDVPAAQGGLRGGDTIGSARRPAGALHAARETTPRPVARQAMRESVEAETAGNWWEKPIRRPGRSTA